MNTLSIHELEILHPDYVAIWAWHRGWWYHYHHKEKILMRNKISDLSSQIVVLGVKGKILARYFDTALSFPIYCDPNFADGRESILDTEPPVGFHKQEA